MPKRALFLALYALTVPLIAMTQAGVDVQVNDGGGQYYDDDTYDGYWYGPGWYWGVYINNEDDYWRHHGNRYGHGGQYYENRHGGGGQDGSGHH